MADDSIQDIRDDLARHATLFDLSRDNLGRDAVDLAVNGVLDHFDAQVDPDGRPWPKLSSDYDRWKQRHYPGEPIGVLEGLMRSELPGGPPAIQADSAEYTAGTSDLGRAELSWFSEGDPAANRPARRVVDLNAGSIGASDQLFGNHFDKGVSG